MPRPFEVISGGSQSPEQRKNAELEKKAKQVLDQAEKRAVDLLIEEFPRLDREQVSQYAHAFSPEHVAILDHLPASDMFDFDELDAYFYKRNNGRDFSGPAPTVGEIEFDEQFQKLMKAMADDNFDAGFERLIQSIPVSMRLDFLRKSLRTSVDRVLEKKRLFTAQGLVRMYLGQQRAVPTKLKLVLTGEEYASLEAEMEGQDAAMDRVQEGVLAKLRLADDERKQGLATAAEHMQEAGVDPKIVQKRTEVAEAREEALGEDAYLRAESMVSGIESVMEQIVKKFDDPRDLYNWLVDVDAAGTLVKAK